jgi:GAF domain-containing protein
MAAAVDMGWLGTGLGTALRTDWSLVEQASTIGEAAVWVLAIAVGHGACEGGLVHCMVPGEPRLVTKAAHGPDATRALGSSVSVNDAAFYGVMKDGANDSLTEWARSMTSLRLQSAGLGVHGVLAMPLRARGAPVGFLEVSAPQRRIAFTPTNLAVLRDLVAAFEARPARI